MFLSLLLIGILFIYVSIWGDYIKILIFLEVFSLVFIIVLLLNVQINILRINYFFRCLIFLVCESRIGFLLFIFYIRIESDVVKKINLVQF